MAIKNLTFALVASFSALTPSFGLTHNYARAGKAAVSRTHYDECALSSVSADTPAGENKTAIFYEDVGVLVLPNGERFCAYSGQDRALNNPWTQWKKNSGAIPNGDYAADIVDDHLFKLIGSPAFKEKAIGLRPLEPDAPSKPDQVLNRDKFDIHHPHYFRAGWPSSIGCIVLENTRAIYEVRQRGVFDKVRVTETSEWKEKNLAFPAVLEQKRLEAKLLATMRAGLHNLRKIVSVHHRPRQVRRHLARYHPHA